MARGLVTLVIVAAALAAPAQGTIGSVISSFIIPSAGYGYGILAQGDRVYLSARLTYGDYIVTYTHSGTLLRSTSIDPTNQYALYSGSRTHLGNGYIGLIDQNVDYLKIFSITNGGAPVASFHIDRTRNVFWNGEHYYINGWSDKGAFSRYTSSGGRAGTWTCAGWPASMQLCGGTAYAHYGNYAAGPYFVASTDYGHSDPCCITTFPGGSLVKTWLVPLSSGHVAHLSYGDSSNPGTYGAAVWALLHSPYYVVEFDIDARGASSVIPASVGKIRAIYR
jgi:hypothetical protein